MTEIEEAERISRTLGDDYISRAGLWARVARDLDAKLRERQPMKSRIILPKGTIVQAGETGRPVELQRDVEVEVLR